MTSPTTASPAARSASGSAGAESTAARDTGLLLLRVVLGLTMAAHGTQKLFGWFGGGGIKGTGQFFEMSGYPSGEAMAVVAGLAETLGGLGLALGLLTPLAGAALVGTLLNVLAVKGTGSFFAPKGIEYELLLTAGAAALTLTGPGRYAADRFLPGLRFPQPRYGVLALVLAVVAAGVVLLVRN
ncbi:DoxX family membrane protein [Streptomyces antimicrobicus]|uniref:DoxX family membrane protein n=1 Tax=Streptomyces antimicrobicus TaxID=2883108 RepID=A0ABS8BB18_9ACTN|nr:DoxX family membrane protein [Streptomyces antimicrobicus]MCB5181810.1 DoxX family membrane protein [Streptomyces antimicrobicus]